MDVVVRRDALESFGLSRLWALHENLSQARLIEASVRRREGMLSEGGSLVVRTGKRTSRSPKDRFIVEDETTAGAVAWGKVNHPFSPQDFGRLLERTTGYLENLDELYVAGCHAGADPRYRLNVQVIAENAWHALFARQLFRRHLRRTRADGNPPRPLLWPPHSRKSLRRPAGGTEPPRRLGRRGRLRPAGRKARHPLPREFPEVRGRGGRGDPTRRALTIF